LTTAIENGFAYAVVNAPIIIADGILSKDSVEVKIDKKHFDTVKIASNIFFANSMIVMSKLSYGVCTCGRKTAAAFNSAACCRKGMYCLSNVHKELPRKCDIFG
jgi:uncharacterized Fe-S center protein